MSIAAQLKANYARHVATQVMPRSQAILEAFLDRDVPRKTGALARSRQIRASATQSGFTLTVTFPPDTANFTNFGVRAHEIRPRRAQALRFVSGGKVVFAKRVQWRPGAGVARNRGWFTRNVALTRWRAILGQVLGR